MDNLCRHSLDYALGEIRDELLKHRYERHLRMCSSCVEEVTEYLDILDTLQTSNSNVESTYDDLTEETGQEKDKVISFPHRTCVHASFVGRRTHRLGRRNALLSVTLTAMAMTLAILVHGGHVRSVATFSDSAFDHVTHTVKIDSSHLKHDLWRI